MSGQIRKRDAAFMPGCPRRSEVAKFAESPSKRATLSTWREACYSDSTTRVVGSVGVIRSAGADERR